MATGLPHEKWALFRDRSGLIYGADSAAVFWRGGDEASLPHALSTRFSIPTEVDGVGRVIVERGRASLTIVERFDVLESESPFE